MRTGFIITLWLLWSTLVFLAPSSVYWRDSGEFIIQAFALDISHPPGFPAYAMIANLFALLPIGPIAWRVVLLSGATFIASCYLIKGILKELFLQQSISVKQANVVAAAVTALILALLALPTILKQALSAEVYTLNAFFLLLISQQIIKGFRLGQLTPILYAAFLGGLALGNHISALFSALPVILIVLMKLPIARKQFDALAMLFVAGLLVYAYLPVRAQTAIPLNTGAPYSVERLWYTISDARDRLLRTPDPSSGEANKLAGFDLLVQNPSNHFVNDMKKLAWPGALPFALFSGAALLIVLFVKPWESLILISIASGNYLFFSGWDGDPWIPAIMIIFVIWIAAIWMMLEKLSVQRFAVQIFLGFSLLLLVLSPAKEIFAQITQFRDYQAPARQLEQWINLGKAPVIISENSWFILRYLSDIEGIGDERIILYQPSFLFPQYFAPVDVMFSDKSIFNSLNHANLHRVAAESPSLPTLGEFIKLSSFASTTMIEPSAPINQAFFPIITFSQSGTAQIVRNRFDSSTEIVPDELFSYLKLLQQGALTVGSYISRDALNYFENILNSNIDLLRRQKKFTAAATILSKLCLPVQAKTCSPVSLNHLGITLRQADLDLQAAQVLLEVVNQYRDQPVIEENLRKALIKLSTEDLKSLAHQEIVSKILK